MKKSSFLAKSAALLALAMPGLAVASTGKLVLPGGVASVEGSAGGGLTP